MLHLSDEYGDSDVEISVGRDGITAEIAGTAVWLGAIACDGSSMTVSGASPGTAFIVQRDGSMVRIVRGGLAVSARIELKIDLPRAPGTNERGGNMIDAPLHGVVSQIFVGIGDTVEKGSAVLQMEAMKLIHTLTAPVSGRIASIGCKAGETVPAGAILVEIDSTDAEEGA